MTWLAQNWIWVLFGIAFVAMHLFGHGGQGGRTGHVSDQTDRGCAIDAKAPKAIGVCPAAPPAVGGQHQYQE